MRILPAIHQTLHHGDSFRGDTLQEWDGGALPLFNFYNSTLFNFYAYVFYVQKMYFCFLCNS